MFTIFKIFHCLCHFCLFDTKVINIQQPKPIGFNRHSDLQNWRHSQWHLIHRELWRWLINYNTSRVKIYRHPERVSSQKIIIIKKKKRLKAVTTNKNSQFLAQFSDAKRWSYPKEEGLRKTTPIIYHNNSVSFFKWDYTHLFKSLNIT